MERPENIKKGLACFAQDRSYMLPCSDCDYHGQGKPPCRKAVHEDALALIEQLEAQVPKWISAEERLPSGVDVFDEGGESFYEPAEYIVKVEGATLSSVAMFDGVNFIPATYKGIVSEREFVSPVTRWMPLPSTEGLRDD